MLSISHVLACRSTCRRRAVGAVLTNSLGHIIGTGYNGVAAGLPHCIEEGNACAGSWAASGKNLDDCEAVHAEQNALLQCPDPWTIDTCYTTVSPCVTCVKLLMNTSCRRIVFNYVYPHKNAETLARQAGIEWVCAHPEVENEQ